MKINIKYFSVLLFNILLLFACSESSKPSEKKSNPEEAIKNAIIKNDVTFVKNWLDQGADPSQIFSDGSTPLYISTGPKGGKEVMEILLKKGADVNLGAGKYTPLMNASSWGAVDLVKILLQYGADKDLKNEEGKNALDLQSICPDCPENKLLQKLLKSDDSFEGMFVYMADANMFFPCDGSAKFPIATQGAYFTLEKKYLSVVDGGTKVYVRVKGQMLETPKMEGKGLMPTLQISEIIRIDKEKNCL